MNSEADARTRTGDPFITSEVLYELSYVGVVASLAPAPPSSQAVDDAARDVRRVTDDSPRRVAELVAVESDVLLFEQRGRLRVKDQLVPLVVDPTRVGDGQTMPADAVDRRADELDS